MSHYEIRRAEILGSRKRRPKTGDRTTRERYLAFCRKLRNIALTRAAANRLGRAIAGAACPR